MRNAIMPGFLSVDERGLPPISIRWLQFLQRMPDMPGVRHLPDADDGRGLLGSIVKLGPPRAAHFSLFHAPQREFEAYLGRNQRSLARYFGRMERKLASIRQGLGPVTRAEVLAMGAHRLTRTEYEAISFSVQMAGGLFESYLALPTEGGRRLMVIRDSLVAELQNELGNLAVRTEVRRALANEAADMGFAKLSQGACFYLNQLGGFFNRIHHVPQVGRAMAGIALFLGIGKLSMGGGTSRTARSESVPA